VGEGADGTRELLLDADSVTAIFAGDDLCAFGVLDALAELGMHVPGDISVVGYDNTPVAGFQKISLTTVEQFAAEIGGEAMRSILARVKRRNRPARHVMVPPRLIERTTTGPPPDVSPMRASDGGAHDRGAR
jgi:LacI family transcriptional regulator